MAGGWGPREGYLSSGMPWLDFIKKTGCMVENKEKQEKKPKHDLGDVCRESQVKDGEWQRWWWEVDALGKYWGYWRGLLKEVQMTRRYAAGWWGGGNSHFWLLKLTVLMAWLDADAVRWDGVWLSALVIKGQALLFVFVVVKPCTVVAYWWVVMSKVDWDGLEHTADTEEFGQDKDRVHGRPPSPAPR